MGGSLNRTEPSNIEDIKANPAVMEIFEQAGWLGFLERFQGSDNQLAMEFAQTFDASQARVKRLNTHSLVKSQVWQDKGRDGINISELQ
jgi:hypothetical protein